MMRKQGKIRANEGLQIFYIEMQKMGINIINMEMKPDINGITTETTPVQITEMKQDLNGIKSGTTTNFDDLADLFTVEYLENILKENDNRQLHSSDHLSKYNESFSSRKSRNKRRIIFSDNDEPN